MVERSIGAAERLAHENWRANCEALEQTQSWFINELASPADGLQWVFGRDGSMTPLNADGTWWGGCSLPRRASLVMFRELGVDATLSCFLDPAWPAQVRVVLDRLLPRQAVLVLIPSSEAAGLFLRCENVADEIDSHRLWLVCGVDWQSQMRRLFDERPGLPIPTQFIRPPGDRQDLDALVDPAQKIFVEVSARRAERVRQTRGGWTPIRQAVRRICVVAPSHFRFWDDAGFALAHAVEAGEPAMSILHFDPDDPACASPLALAMKAAECDAVIVPHASRADWGHTLPDELPLITWATTSFLPDAASAGPRDVLLVADPAWRARAIQDGWPSHAVGIAGWPENPSCEPDNAQLRGPVLAIIADTRSLDPHPRVADFSSHALLWEQIAAEVVENPFELQGDPQRYLVKRIRAAGFENENLDRALFFNALLVPAYQQGLACCLVRAGLPVQLYGEGWDQAADLRPHARGPVRTRQALASFAARAAALVYAWPSEHAHPIDSMGRPVLRVACRNRGAFLAEARGLLQGRFVRGPAIAPLSFGTLVRSLER